jgi:hypothetical protein
MVLIHEIECTLSGSLERLCKDFEICIGRFWTVQRSADGVTLVGWNFRDFYERYGIISFKGKGML